MCVPFKLNINPQLWYRETPALLRTDQFAILWSHRKANNVTHTTLGRWRRWSASRKRNHQTYQPTHTNAQWP